VGNKPSILFAISDTGGGHRAGAEGISAALQQLVGDEIDIHIVDILTSTNFPIVRDAPDLYNQLSTRWLPVYDFFYQLTDGRRRVDLLTQFVYLRAHRHIMQVLEDTRPTLVVSVHPLANRLIGNTRRQYRLSFRFLTVVTDLASLHSAWADPSTELCIVPTQEAFKRLKHVGMPAEKMHVTGFPVHPKFTNYSKTQEQTRKDLGIAEEPFTVLLTSGGVGSGNLRELVIELDQAYPDIQFLVITGRNTQLRQELEAADLGENVRLYGFVSNMEEMMAASDIVITKAGPGTLMEALVMRKPVIVTQAVGMQEQGNIDLVLNYELGAFCPTPDRIIPAIAELRDPEVYQATMQRLDHAVPRDGAFQIAQVLLDQMQLAPPRPRRRLRLLSIDELREFGSARLNRLNIHLHPQQLLRLREFRETISDELNLKRFVRTQPWRNLRLPKLPLESRRSKQSSDGEPIVKKPRKAKRQRNKANPPSQQ
jgi:1,2-diacylglycerol 3-beta-galactosyltransferase